MGSPTSSVIAPGSNGAEALRFADVWIGFDEGPILRGLSFSLETGETLVLLGETGTGKTLTLKLAASLLRPDSGTVRALGQEISAKSERELLHFRRQIGFVFQEGALFDSLTVGENVAYRLHEDGVRDEEIGPRVSEVLKFVELAHTVDMLPSDLSGGMRRRVSIARALVTRPPIVFYDSPTAGLDPITSQTIISLILRLRDTYGVTALLATHRLQDGFALANFFFDAESNRVLPNEKKPQPRAEMDSNTRFVVLRDGKVFFEGSTEDLAAAKDPYLKRFLV